MTVTKISGKVEIIVWDVKTLLSQWREARRSRFCPQDRHFTLWGTLSVSQRKRLPKGLRTHLTVKDTGPRLHGRHLLEQRLSHVFLAR
jgi:hypothetical protein